MAPEAFIAPELAIVSFSRSRIISFVVALVSMLALWLFLRRTYIGTAIRAISQDRQIMPLMGVDTRKVYVITSAPPRQPGW